MILWNIAGLTNKKEEFWAYVKEFDILMFLETWLEEHKESILLSKIGTQYKWKTLPAEREKRKGRAKGGQLIAIKKTLNINYDVIRWKKGLRVCWEKNQDNGEIISVYNDASVKDLEEGLNSLLKDREEINDIVLVGDFNARTGEEDPSRMDGYNETERKSQDKVINAEGRKLLELCNKEGWKILNGNCEGDEGKLTYVGPRGASVLDYVIVSRELSCVKDMKIEDRMESDHMPIIAKLDWTCERKEECLKQYEGPWIWNELKAEQFKKEIERRIPERKCKEPEEDLQILNKIIGETAKELKFRKRGKQYRKAYDTKYKRKKKEMWKKLKMFLRTKKDRDRVQYVKTKKELRKLEKEKIKTENEARWKKLENAKNSKEFWEQINKERKKRGGFAEGIKMKTWENYFMSLLKVRKEKIIIESEDGIQMPTQKII